MSEARWTRLARGRVPGLGEAVLRRLLRRLERGRLVVVLPGGGTIQQRGTQPGAEAGLELHDWRPLLALLRGGDTGLAESYAAGAWSSPDLPALLRFGVDNMAALRSVTAAATWPARLIARLRHWANRNSRAGSRRNIMAHYDLGNDFYARWLDESMTYSSALYAAPDEDLGAAQGRKLDRIIALLAPRPGDAVLEIGCGWGALATRLAQEGAKVTGLTLSPAQASHARDFVEKSGRGGAVEIALRDYRDETGSYDRIVSIEMLEAVGEAYWPAYFSALRARLRPGGRAVLQVITIAEDRFASYRRTPDFIQTHIFPGGMLPTGTIIATAAKRAGLALISSECFGASYELTLAEWRRRFLRRWPEMAREGFTASFGRLWDYYLAYCMAGFAAGVTDVGLYVLEPLP